MSASDAKATKVEVWNKKYFFNKQKNFKPQKMLKYPDSPSINGNYTTDMKIMIHVLSTCKIKSNYGHTVHLYKILITIKT